MFYSKNKEIQWELLAKADSIRQEFISVSVNGIENVKGLALEPGLNQWREIEANYIIAADEMQKKSAVLQNITSTN